MIKLDNYRRIKTYITQFMHEGTTGVDSIYKLIYRKYEKFAKYTFELKEQASLMQPQFGMTVLSSFPGSVFNWLHSLT